MVGGSSGLLFFPKRELLAEKTALNGEMWLNTNESISYFDGAEGFIRVHHLTPLSEIGHEYTVDPITNLRPVCAQTTTQ